MEVESASAERTEQTRVDLPGSVAGNIDVFLNGVAQHEGSDYVRMGNTLIFRRPLQEEGKLGFWRWLSLFLGIAGTYRQNDKVDVVYEAGGRRVVATDLPLKPHEPRKSG